MPVCLRLRILYAGLPINDDFFAIIGFMPPHIPSADGFMMDPHLDGDATRRLIGEAS